MAQSKPGSFSAYLQYAQRDLSGPSNPSSSASLLSLLNRFPDRRAPMSAIADLSQMSAPEFRDSLKKLSESGFITISGEPLSEQVSLTAKGQDAIALL